MSSVPRILPDLYYTAHSLSTQEKTCPWCGKRFMALSEDWVYREGTRYYCSWSCYRHNPEKKKKSRRSGGTEQAAKEK